MPCQDPIDVPGKEGVKAVCRKCDECRKEWRRRWIGRLMAEQRESVETWFVTYTYGGGYLNKHALIHNKDHIKKTNQKLRRHGYDFRIYGIGDFGGEHDRAHWHLIYFWRNKPPIAPMYDPKTKKNERIMWQMPRAKTGRNANRIGYYWEHGFTQLAYPKSENGCMAYIMDYLDKEYDPELQLYSHSPPLGQRYLLKWAARKAENGEALFPSGYACYQVDGNVKDKGPNAGQPYDYNLDPNSSIFERVLQTYVKTWVDKRRNQIMPYCKYVNQWAMSYDFEEREIALSQETAMYLGVLERAMKFKTWSVKGKVGYFNVEWDDEILVVADSETGQCELRRYRRDGRYDAQKRNEDYKSLIKRKPQGVKLTLTRDADDMLIGTGPVRTRSRIAEEKEWRAEGVEAEGRVNRALGLPVDLQRLKALKRQKEARRGR